MRLLRIAWCVFGIGILAALLTGCATAPAPVKPPAAEYSVNGIGNLTEGLT